MTTARTSSGFTLIELISVIVILGSLSAVAVPRFLNLQDAARLSKLQNMRGIVSSATNLAFSQAAAEGKLTGASSIDMGGNMVNIHSGFPVASWNDALRYIVNLDNIGFIADPNSQCNISWCGAGTVRSIAGGISVAAPGFIAKFIPRGYSFNDACSVYYINPANGDAPTVGITSGGC